MSEDRLCESFLSNWDVDPAFSSDLIREQPPPGNVLCNDTLDRHVSLYIYAFLEHTYIALSETLKDI